MTGDRRRALIVGIQRYRQCDDALGSEAAAQSIAQLMADRPTQSQSIGWGALDEILLASNAEVEVTTKTLVSKLNKALQDTDDFLFYFGGHAFVVGNDDDLLLATSDTDIDEQSGGVLFSSLTGIIDASGVRQATIILDCRGSNVIRKASIPQRQLVMTVMNPVSTGWEVPRAKLAFSEAFARALSSAENPSGEVTALSAFSYAVNELTRVGNYEPILMGSMVGSRVLRRNSRWTDDLWGNLSRLFPEEGSSYRVTPDHEWPRVEPQWGELYVQQTDVESKADFFDFRSRPYDWDVHKLGEYVTAHLITEEQAGLQRDQAVLKTLIDHGLAEVVTSGATPSLFFACLTSGTVRLNDRGKELWRDMQARVSLSSK